MKCSVVATMFSSNCRDTMPWSLFTPLCYRRTFRLWKYITLHMKRHNGRKHWGCLERKSGFFLLFEQLSMLCLQFTPWPSTLHQNYFRSKTQTAPVCWCERFDKYHDCPCGERMLLHLCQSHFVSIKSSSASNKIDNITLLWRKYKKGILRTGKSLVWMLKPGSSLEAWKETQFLDWFALLWINNAGNALLVCCNDASWPSHLLPTIKIHR